MTSGHELSVLIGKSSQIRYKIKPKKETKKKSLYTIISEWMLASYDNGHKSTHSTL